jgi:malate dehydrogenase (oxaloacetate-decarboxylating)
MPRSLTDGGNTVVTTRLPSAGFSITIRIAVTADVSSIGRLTTCVGEADAIVTAHARRTARRGT